MEKILILLIFVLSISAMLLFPHEVHATTYTLSDQASCQAAPLHGVWSIATSTCVNSGTITINPDDTLEIKNLIILLNMGTIHIDGTISNHGWIINNHGTIDMGVSSNSNLIYNYNVIDNEAASTFNVDNGAVDNYGYIFNDGSYQNGANLWNYGTFENLRGTFYNPDWVGNWGVFTNYGGALLHNVWNIENHAGGIITNDGQIDNTNAGIIKNDCGATFNQNGGFSGNAVVFISCPTITTKTTLTSSQNPAVVNTPVTFTATVETSSGSPVTVGTVTFYVNGVPYQTVSVSSTGIEQFDISTLPIGSYTICADYTGKNGFTNSSDCISLLVMPSRPTLIVSPTYGAGGTIVSIYGYRFDPYSTINHNWIPYIYNANFKPGDPIKTDKYGNFVSSNLAKRPIPNLNAAQTIRYVATEGTNSASASFIVASCPSTKVNSIYQYCE